MKRFGALLGAALLAYLLFLQFVFPGYIALPVPFHDDMYSALQFVMQHYTFGLFLHWPRPVYFETELLAGHFGLEGSLVFLTLIVVCDLALALLVFERLFVVTGVPWWLALATFLLAMAGPGFYAQPAFDVGYHLAMLFGLLGILFWESRARAFQAASFTVSAACFTLSTLSNEGFVPALVIYGIVAAVRARGSAIAAALALPLISIAAAYVDERLVHSPIVAAAAPHGSAYSIDLSLASLAHCAHFYLASLANPALFALLAVCLIGLWLNRRLAAGAVLLGTALLLYAPYVLLPNHLDILYQWTPMPLLMLLVPLAWTPSTDATRSRVANAGIAVALTAAVAFQTTQWHDQKHFYRSELEANRAIIAGLRSQAPLIAQSRAVLVQGINAAWEPWAQTAQSLSGVVPFGGTWTVETEPGMQPIQTQSNAKPIAPSQVHYNEFDLVLDFNGDGRLVKTVVPKHVKPVAAQ